MSTWIEVQQDGEFIEWRIKRPDRMNALGTKLAEEFSSLLADLKKQLNPKSKSSKAKGLRGLIIRAEAVTKGAHCYWIAGGDLQELSALRKGPAVSAYIDAYQNLCRQLEQLPIAVIAAIDGVAIGGGAELALSADIRLGTSAAGFHFKQLEVGLATGYGGAKRLVDLLGRARAQQLLYLPSVIASEESLNQGLLTHLCSSLDNGLNDVKTFLRSIDSKAFAAQKLMLLEASQGQKTSFYAAEKKRFLPLWGNPHHETFLKRFRK